VIRKLLIYIPTAQTELNQLFQITDGQCCFWDGGIWRSYRSADVHSQYPSAQDCIV